jgi:hypothetical protein
MASEAKVTFDETLDGYCIVEDVVSDEAAMRRCKGFMALSTKCGRRSYQKTRSSLRIANKFTECNTNEVSDRKRKNEGGF